MGGRDEHVEGSEGVGWGCKGKGQDGKEVRRGRMGQDV